MLCQQIFLNNPGERGGRSFRCGIWFPWNSRGPRDPSLDPIQVGAHVDNGPRAPRAVNLPGGDID